MNKKTEVITLLFSSLILFFGCNTLKQPKEIPNPLNYSDEDVIASEIERIKVFKKTECVKALWRSLLLGKEEIIADCYSLVKNQIAVCLDEKNYIDAVRYISSLQCLNRNDPELADFEKQITNLSEEKAFSLIQDSDKSPKTISDCVKATVTVWVDKGIKVENGAGLADIVIGSGFFIDKRGYIITNHHVIQDLVDPKYEGFSRLYVKMQPDTDTKIPAKVIGYDSVIDLALLKVEVEPEFILTLGSSENLSIGDKISAIGTPIGLEGTLTAGIISSVDRKLMTLGNVFQIDAAVNSGNSGGPLIDEKMEVQAIVFAGMLQFQGLNFAIPVEYLKQELQFLYAGGKVNHPWIAAYGRSLRKGSKTTGLEVQYLIPGGSGFMSGLKEGDVIIEAGGKPVTSIDDFQFTLMAYSPGTILECKYKTIEGDIKSVYLYLENRADSPGELVYKSDFITGSFIPLFGMKLVPASTTNRNSYMIEKVIRGGIADETGFSENDFVTVKDIRIDYQNKYIAAQLFSKRRTKGFLEIGLVLSNALDSPYYF